MTIFSLAGNLASHSRKYPLGATTRGWGDEKEGPVLLCLSHYVSARPVVKREADVFASLRYSLSFPPRSSPAGNLVCRPRNNLWGAIESGEVERSVRLRSLAGLVTRHLQACRPYIPR